MIYVRYGGDNSQIVSSHIWDESVIRVVVVHFLFWFMSLELISLLASLISYGRVPQTALIQNQITNQVFSGNNATSSPMDVSRKI